MVKVLVRTGNHTNGLLVRDEQSNREFDRPRSAASPATQSADSAINVESAEKKLR